MLLPILAARLEGVDAGAVPNIVSTSGPVDQIAGRRKRIHHLMVMNRPCYTRCTVNPINRQLVPFALAAFLGFLAIGIPLPVLPVFAHDALGFGPVIVGLVVGSQSLATLLSRQHAGRTCDERGPKRVALAGLLCASGTGLLYLLANALTGVPVLALSILMGARLLLGFAESLFITSLAVWSIAKVGQANAGRAMAWSGMAMYGAVALGAPIGSALESAYGFNVVFGLSIGLPLLGAMMIAPWQDEVVEPRPRVAFFKILLRIWLPGLGMALASSGVGTISAFLVLRYRELGLGGAGVAFAGFGGAYILVRLVLGGLPDRIGGLLAGMISLAIETLGLLIVWRADASVSMLVGASITGLGYSLVFPSLGVEAIRRSAGENRGMVLGAYLASFDLGVALAGPTAGIVVSRAGLASAFLAAALASSLAFALVVSARLRNYAGRMQQV